MRLINIFALLLLHIFLLQLTPSVSLANDPCLKTCVLDPDCGVGGICDVTCSYKPNFCASERWSVNDRSEFTNCNAFTCDENSGLCRRQASTPIHCTQGYVFNGNSSCIPSVQCDPKDNPGCQKLLDQWKIARDAYEARTPAPNPPQLTCRPCTGHNQCSGAEMCWQNRCVRAASFCLINTNKEWSANLKDGTSKSCGAFACDASSGTCFDTCVSFLDCQEGKVCQKGICQ